MKKTILLLILPFFGLSLFAQQKEAADKLVGEGIELHDKGQYDAAISMYDKALALDKDNLLALAEKAYSLMSLGKYDESIKCCEKALEVHAGNKGLKTVYTTLGNALDGAKKPEKALEIYDQGITQFPDFYLLYFNKGITLAGNRKTDEAISNLQTALLLNPDHPGSHNILGRVLNTKHQRIPALLAYGRFLVLEPESKRAAENLASIQEILKGNVEKTGKNAITISVSPDMLRDTTAAGKSKENNFSSVDLLMNLNAGLDYDKKYKKETEVERFIRKFETLCSSLKEQKEKNTGFYWDYYVPYFIEMKDKQLMETFGYIAFASTEDKDVSKWLKSHGREIDEFYKWSEGFAWKTK